MQDVKVGVPNLYTFSLIARDIYDRTKEILESEEKLEEYWKDISGFRALDRTGDARLIIDRIFKDAWDKHFPGINPIVKDKIWTVRVMQGEDYNLISQIVINLLPCWIQYDIASLNGYIVKTTEELKEIKEASDPHMKKAKYVEKPENPQGWEERYNSVLGCLKFNSTVKPSQLPSFRLSPLGTTPALTDSANYSSASPYTDQFIVDEKNSPIQGRTIRHISWDLAPQITEIGSDPDGAIAVKGLSQKYYSRSGGDILNRAMFSRYIVSKLIHLDIITIIPRLSSITIVTNTNMDEEIIKINQQIIEEFPGLGLFFGSSRIA